MTASIIHANELSQDNSTVFDYITLLKPRVMSLVVFSGLAGLLVAPGEINPFIGFIAVLCIALGSGASGAINMWYDADIDAQMERTKRRPTVKGRIAPDDARDFGIVLAFFSVLLMAICVNYISAVILLVAILSYVFIYTIWLKRSTPQNIVIGGSAGAFPPLIGWTAVTGNIDVNALILFMVIFLWTPAHFWALALYKSDDYKKAGIPMMPITHGDQYTKYMILIYSIATVIFSLLPFIMGFANQLYLAASLALGGGLIGSAIMLMNDKKNRFAPKAFTFSILYLFALFLALITDHYMG